MTGVARRATVIVASTGAAEHGLADATGPVLVAWLQKLGYMVPDPIVVADGAPVGAALRDALDEHPTLIVTTGGTGVSFTDRTPEETAPLIDVPVPGIIESLRRRGAETVPTAVLTRGEAGFAGDTFIVNLPGSRGGVDDGIAVLSDVLSHLLGQRHGTPDGDHPAAGVR